MKCKCCEMGEALSNKFNACIVCNELITQSACETVAEYIKAGGHFPQNKFEATPFNFTNEEVIKAVKTYCSKCRPSGYGEEDDGYNEHMSEMAYIIEEAEKGNTDMKKVCADLCFNPARHL